jgi:capsular polysaccharide biosynthesis protein
MTRRIYLSRRGAKHRRITNEAALWQLLAPYGFEQVEVERLTFREQVELFHRCEILVGAHGAGLATSIFSGPINMVVLYATNQPPNYFHTQAIALGQKHWHVCSEFQSEDADFAVNVDEVRRILEEKLAHAI